MPACKLPDHIPRHAFISVQAVALFAVADHGQDGRQAAGLEGQAPPS
jgi:hypothetical protein